MLFHYYLLLPNFNYYYFGKERKGLTTSCPTIPFQNFYSQISSPTIMSSTPFIFITFGTPPTYSIISSLWRFLQIKLTNLLINFFAINFNTLLNENVSVSLISLFIKKWWQWLLIGTCKETWFQREPCMSTQSLNFKVVLIKVCDFIVVLWKMWH